MKALSIRSPWWWWILHGGKDVENRDWATRHRGAVLIHASSWWRLCEVEDDWTDCLRLRREILGPDVGPVTREPITWRDLRDAGGHIVGEATIIDCVSASNSPWFTGPYGFVFANVQAFERPIPWRGALGLFHVPASAVAAHGSSAQGSRNTPQPEDRS